MEKSSFKEKKIHTNIDHNLFCEVHFEMEIRKKWY